MSVLELVAVAGLRPYKILKLYQELGISSLADLEAAAKEDRLRPVKGLGASLQTKILQNLAIARSGETQLHLHKAAALLEHAVESLKHDHPYCRASLTALSSSVARVVVLASAVPSKLTSYATYTRAIVKTPAPPPRHSSQSSGRNTRSITTRKQRNRKRKAIVCGISVTALDYLR
jgi:hypothetical protein